MAKNKEELLTLFGEILKDKNLLIPVGMLEENHKPHPFQIGKKHTDAAAAENEGVLSEEICERYKCYHKKCKLKYTQHTAEMTLMLSLTRDGSQSQVNDELLKIKEALLENEIAGVSFVENEGEEKFKFLQ